MCHFNSSNDIWLQTAAISLTVQKVIFVCGLQMFLLQNLLQQICLFFKEKYQKETLCLTRSIKPVCRKRIFGFDEKENRDIEKLLC